MYIKHNQNNAKVGLHYVKLTNQFHLDLQKVDQQTVGKWLIHGTKHHKDTQ